MGVLGAEVWVALAAPGEPPPVLGESFPFLSIDDSRTVLVAQYDGIRFLSCEP